MANRAEVTRRYRESHREEIRAKGRAYQAEKREDPAYLERQRKYQQRRRVEDPDGARAIRERFKEKHPGYDAARQKEWRERNPERQRESAITQYLRTRVSAAPYKPQAVDMSPEAQAQRKAEYGRRWRAENRALYRVSKANAQIRRRARKQGAGRIEMIDRRVIFERDGGRCHICRRSCSPTRFHLDHLVPLSKGGTHTADNVAVAHPRCNVSRGAGRIPAQLRLVG